MRYLSESCPYCGVAFDANDDIVVCPECGTPHHRACWRAHGECANTEKHAEGYVWQKAAEAQKPEPEPEKEKQAPAEDPGKKSLDIVCPDCGKVSPNGTLRCPDCGALLIPFNPMGGEPPIAQFMPGFDPNEEIGEIKSGDVALYCRVSGARYIKAFKRLKDKKKLSWNWGAAFFSPYWFFYRKLYKAGAIFLALFVAVSLWLMPVGAKFYETYENVILEARHMIEEGDEAGAEAMLIESTPEIMEAMRPMYLPLTVQFLLHIAAAFAADRIYYKKAKVDIMRVRRQGLDPRKFQLELFKKGGTSLVGAALSYFGCEAVLYAASWLINR
ncbi:MAG: DUF2628 domain-containing protein [Clostridia bacterium]|nr:DUF2628 domain-containing protein [Clostridia bacterium]